MDATLLSVALGVCLGLGLLVVYAAFRGRATPRTATRQKRRLVPDQIALRITAAALGAAVLGLATGWPVLALAGAVAGWQIPQMVIRRQTERLHMQRAVGLIEFIELLADMLEGSGQGLEAVVRSAAQVAPRSVRRETEILAAELGGRVSMAEALAAFAGVMADPICDQMVMAFRLGEFRAARPGAPVGRGGGPGRGRPAAKGGCQPLRCALDGPDDHRADHRHRPAARRGRPHLRGPVCDPGRAAAPARGGRHHGPLDLGHGPGGADPSPPPAARAPGDPAMIPWLLPALGLGIGLWLLLLGAMPARTSLAEGMARLRLLPEPPPLATRPIAQPSALIRAGTPLAGALLRRSGALGLRVLGGLVSPEDLAVVGQTPERHVAEKLASCLTGLALPLLLAAVLGIAGGVLQTTVAIPLAIPLWLALVLGLGGFIAPDLVVRSNAVTRRREMVDDLTVFVQTVAMSLTANRGIEAALHDGAGAGDSWGFVQLRAALSEARIGQERPWDALGRLGSELGLDTLEELAARVALAGQDGARIAESLQTFSETLRGRRLIRVEAEEHVASEQMAAVSVLPLVGFTLFLAAPAFLTLLK